MLVAAVAEIMMRPRQQLQTPVLQAVPVVVVPVE
jgi:hypothetical protein